MKHATVEQIGEIVRQLTASRPEIDRSKAQLIIENRLKLSSRGSIRAAQARVLFEKFGKVLGCETFSQYLDAEGRDSFEPVPQIPTWPGHCIRVFGGENICLADQRILEKIGLKEYCKLAGLAYHGEDDTFEPFYPKQVKEGIYWMLYQDGFRNRNRTPNNCRESFQSFEVGLSAVEGISVYIQNPAVIEGHVMDLPGSVHREDRGSVAVIGCFIGGPRLHWNRGDDVSSRCGSASRAQ